jgi:IS30 family transposase
LNPLVAVVPLLDLVGRQGSIRAAPPVCIGTLVERSTRYVMLMKLEKNTAEQVRLAMSKKIRSLPTELRRSIT